MYSSTLSLTSMPPLGLFTSRSVKGTWKEGSLAGTQEDRYKRLWRWASLSSRASLGNLEGGSSTRDFVRWMMEALGMVHFSEEAHCRGPLGKVPLLGTLEYILRKALDAGISLHRGPFKSHGNLESGEGLVYRGL